MRSLVVLDEEEVQSHARVPVPQRLGPQVPEVGKFQDLREQIQEMQRKINKGRVFTTRTNTLLAPEIFAEPYPQGFKMSFVKRYDGESDPQEHINSYVQVMIAVDASDALMYRCFLQTVDSKVADWVNHVPAGSIRTWDETSSSDGLLHTDLTTHPPDTFEEAMVRAGRYVTLKERKEEKKEKIPKEEEKAGNKKPFKNKKQGFPDGPKGTSPGTSEKHKSANPVFTLPVAEVGEVTAQFLRAEERRPRVEVAGDIEEVELEPGMPGRLVRIGRGLGAELRSRVISVLRRFRKVFAWSPADMPGLDHKIAVHRLNVLQDAKPVKQKRMHLLQERRDFVKKELTTLQKKAHPFFTVLKKRTTFEWTQECQLAFEELKRYLASPLVLSKPEPGDVLTLYLAIADYAISTVIVREQNGAQHPVYYVSKTLRDAELRYSRPEKAMLAVFWTTKRLTPYFQAHRIVVLTNESLASLTRSPAASAIMTKWAVFISQYNLEFRPRPSIKGQALADFQVECTVREMTRARVETRVEDDWLVMSIDGSSGSRSCGAGIVLITPESFRIYYAIRFQFRVSNNEAEYEALINGVKILGKLGVSRVQVYSDSRLVVGQISGEFEAKEERMKKYRNLSLEIAESPEYISKLATVEELATPSLNRDEVLWVSADPPEWLDRLARYIEDGVAPEDPQEAWLLRMRAPTYKVQEGVLYKRSYNGVLLRCLRAAEAKAIMEEIHEGVCAAHQGPYSISRRAIIQGYFWPTMRKDCGGLISWVPCRKGIGQARWIVVAIDYFTKWVEAEPLAGITGKQMIDFVGTNILCRFGVPKQIISDNGTQFEEAEFQDFLKTWGIQHTKVSVAYPLANGQVENVNRTIISGIKKKLMSEGSNWVDELPRVLWTYRTTPRRATGDTPFGLAYGSKARAPAETVIPTRREMTYDPEVNE
ncbi:unnamed protein product [Cuscuta campestris]|uniref:Integrase catalytic domain-containing protein n=1 Tax=Cuscuta campestris TaxID=132261 RepID=A0A484M8S9_9ASTE|nr:unnamed protein product [Cuscuta campestris]